MKPADQCAICGPSKLVLLEKIVELEAKLVIASSQACRMTAALHVAELFMSDELDCRRRSFLHGEDDEDDGYIAIASESLSVVHSAFTDNICAHEARLIAVSAMLEEQRARVKELERGVRVKELEFRADRQTAKGLRMAEDFVHQAGADVDQFANATNLHIVAALGALESQIAMAAIELEGRQG